MNNNILKVCPDDSAYKYRPGTDVLFKISDGAFNYSGLIDSAIRHIEKIQLMRKDLWSLFVKQFRTDIDDENKGWRCEYWGKMMRGACFTYQYTQNQELYNLLCDTVRDLMSTQDELGRIATYSVEAEFDGWDLWGRKYVMLGLQYFIDICKDESFKKEIIACMCRHADYIISKVGAEEGKKRITLCTTHWKGVNVSSILEPYVRLYNLTNEKRYLDFAKYIIDNGGMEDGDMFELVCEGKLYPYEMPVTKAYETMSCLEGLLEYYRITKIEKYRDALVKFAEKIIETDITVIGCSGCTHELFDFSAKRQTVTQYNDIMQETCVTVTWMKFCYQLLCATGYSKLADAIELSAYNSMLGAVNSYNSTMNGGMAFDSYAPLFMDTRCRKIGGFQYMEEKTAYYGCCACIGAAGTALIGLSSVMQGENGIFVNLYIPGTVDVNTPSGTPFKLTIDTKYPSSSKINVFVKGTKGDEEFTLAFRIPEWCKNAKMKVCGEEVAVVNGTYAKVTRKWNCCDKIEFDFEMEMKVVYPPYGGVEGDEGSKYLVALTRGPVAFARDKRLGEEIDSIVDIAVDENGIVNAKESHTAEFPTEQEYRIPMKDGSYITVVDYQSAGKTWDEKSMMTVWMPTKNFWSFDDTKRVEFNSRLFLSSVHEECGYVYYSGDNSNTARWFFEKTEDGKLMIRYENGGYLTAEWNDELKVYCLAVREKGAKHQTWRLEHSVVNRYRLFEDELNLALSYAYITNHFILCDVNEDVCIHGNNLPNNAFISIRNV